MKKIVLNIPHSSINGIFDKEIGKWPYNVHFYNECVRYHTDWYTDLLFATNNPNVTGVVFPYSRFVCDVERLENDPLEKIGQGIIYHTFNGYDRHILSESAEALLQAKRVEHYYQLIKALGVDNNILIDCHSFSNEIAPNVDICIGYNDDWSYNKDVISIIQSEFTKSGYKVAFNEPYSNSLTPTHLGQYISVMIEVNKRIYMDEKTLLLNPNTRQWIRWKGCWDRILEKLTNME